MKLKLKVGLALVFLSLLSYDLMVTKKLLKMIYKNKDLAIMADLTYYKERDQALSEAIRSKKLSTEVWIDVKSSLNSLELSVASKCPKSEALSLIRATYLRKDKLISEVANGEKLDQYWLDNVANTATIESFVSKCVDSY